MRFAPLKLAESSADEPMDGDVIELFCRSDIDRDGGGGCARDARAEDGDAVSSAAEMELFCDACDAASPDGIPHADSASADGDPGNCAAARFDDLFMAADSASSDGDCRPVIPVAEEEARAACACDAAGGDAVFSTAIEHSALCCWGISHERMRFDPLLSRPIDRLVNDLVSVKRELELSTTTIFQMHSEHLDALSRDAKASFARSRARRALERSSAPLARDARPPADADELDLSDARIAGIAAAWRDPGDANAADGDDGIAAQMDAIDGCVGGGGARGNLAKRRRTASATSTAATATACRSSNKYKTLARHITPSARGVAHLVCDPVFVPFVDPAARDLVAGSTVHPPRAGQPPVPLPDDDPGSEMIGIDALADSALDVAQRSMRLVQLPAADATDGGDDSRDPRRRRRAQCIDGDCRGNPDARITSSVLIPVAD